MLLRWVFSSATGVGVTGMTKLSPFHRTNNLSLFAFFDQSLQHAIPLLCVALAGKTLSPRLVLKVPLVCIRIIEQVRATWTLTCVLHSPICSITSLKETPTSIMVLELLANFLLYKPHFLQPAGKNT